MNPAVSEGRAIARVGPVREVDGNVEYGHPPPRCGSVLTGS